MASRVTNDEFQFALESWHDSRKIIKINKTCTKVCVNWMLAFKKKLATTRNTFSRFSVRNVQSTIEKLTPNWNCHNDKSPWDEQDWNIKMYILTHHANWHTSLDLTLAKKSRALCNYHVRFWPPQAAAVQWPMAKHLVTIMSITKSPGTRPGGSRKIINDQLRTKLSEQLSEKIISSSYTSSLAYEF